MNYFRELLFQLLLLTLTGLQAFGADKLIIAENGGSRGLMEHSLPALTLAVATGVDVLELHVALTVDQEVIVFKDRTLNRLTDVADHFPGRNRTDGGFYVSDFTLMEIRQLRLRNVFAGDRDSPAFAIPALTEELRLIQYLEKQFNHKVQIALEITFPYHYRDQDLDISSLTLDILNDFGYSHFDSGLYLQCFDPAELRRIHSALMVERQMQLPLIQLVGENDGMQVMTKLGDSWQAYNYDWMFTYSGLHMVASYAWAIALPSHMVVNDDGARPFGGYLEEIKKFGLQLLVYPVRDTPEELPAFADDFIGLLDFYYNAEEVDGIYTNAYKLATSYQEKLAARKKQQDDLT